MSRRKIAIIAAMACEIDILKEAIEEPIVENVAGIELYSGSIENVDVVFAQCGMGKVSAALGAQAMISLHHPDCLINTGCAGALSPLLNVGDMVLATKTAEWDLDTIDIGNPRGFVSSMNQVYMNADDNLAKDIASYIEEKLYSGLIVSGDVFVDKKEQRELILNAFPDALCTEMEGAAIGHVCAQNAVPFAILRCISDNANGDSGISFAEFAPIAGKKSAQYLLKLLHNK